MSSRRSLPQLAGWEFLTTAFISRLPASMVQLGYLMVLAQDGRGFGIAGLAVAAVGLGSAVSAPILGRFMDRIGPFPVVATATVTSLIGQLSFLAALLAHQPSWVLLACAALVGLSNPQIGSVARSYWSRLAERHHDNTLISRALGYEGAIDEIGFVIGPILSSLLVSLQGAATATITMAVMTALLQGTFLTHLFRHRHEWVKNSVTHQNHAHGRIGSIVVLPMLAAIAVGTVFGSTQTALTNLYQLRNTAAMTGVVYGCVGIGSGTASLLIGRYAHQLSRRAKVAAGGLFILIGGALLLLLPAPLLALGMAVILGAGAGITLVSAFTWMESVAPRDRIATMMTALSTCITLGVSLGAVVSGRLASVPIHAFLPALVAGVVTLTVAVKAS
ncbi:MAG: MFS transporter [Propionibacteriaceae bacterium]